MATWIVVGVIGLVAAYLWMVMTFRFVWRRHDEEQVLRDLEYEQRPLSPEIDRWLHGGATMTRDQDDG